MAQPEPDQIAQHLHNAADQVALFSNLPAVHDAQMLQNIMDGITQIRQDMNAGFARVEARLLAVETRLLRVDENSRARIHNASINSSRLPLEVLLTPQNYAPPGFPANSAQLSALTTAQLDALFEEYDLPQGGNVEAKRRAFRRFIGISSDV